MPSADGRIVTGVYGGTFDPVHNAHLAVAEGVLHAGLADEVWLMVSPLNPLKKDKTISPDADRLAMARLAVADRPGIKVSEFEMRLPVPSYSFNTLSALERKYPERRFTLIIGGDNYAIIERWRQWEEIVRRWGLIVYPRPGYKIGDLHRNVRVLRDVEVSGVSSTLIRQMVAEGKSISGMTPPAVAEYITTKGLYR